MTQTLKKQLTTLCGALVLGGALVWGSGSLRAQNNSRPLGITTPRVPLSRDEAARNFAKLLEVLGGSRDESRRQRLTEQTELMSSFSLQSERELGDNLGELMAKMASQWRAPQFDVQVQSESADSAVVVVGAESKPVTRAFTLIREGNSWGVDVFGTYAKWNGLDGSAKSQARADLLASLGQAREDARRASCQSNLKQIALGIAQYVQDYDEKLPPAKPWIDVLQPYVKSEQIFRCPAVTDPKGYGYAYNSRLSQKNLAAVESISQTASIYETSVLKRNAYGMGENPAFRHLGGANYAFVDGHVKWFDKTQIPSFNLKQ